MFRVSKRTDYRGPLVSTDFVTFGFTFTSRHHLKTGCLVVAHEYMDDLGK